jgi:hypothetical protein
VSLFRRGRRSEDDEGGAEDVQARDAASVELVEPEDEGGAEDEPGAGGTGRGPWDSADVPEPGARIDLGALWLPARDGMELRMELDQESQRVTAAAIALHGSNLQVQVFAAPRREGIWDEIRAEIAASVTKQGGTVDDLPGPFGRELLARLPVRTPEGRTAHRPARFVGYDGPRWFLRGVLTGQAAVDPVAADELEGVFADVVVVRGNDPRAPRDLLDLRLPGQTPAATTAPGPADEIHTRGPEITEVR